MRGAARLCDNGIYLPWGVMKSKNLKKLLIPWQLRVLESFGFEKAMDMLRRNSGSHFDPELLRTFSGIASSLYQEASHADDSTLATLLNQLASKHFLNA